MRQHNLLLTQDASKLWECEVFLCNVLAAYFLSIHTCSWLTISDSIFLVWPRQGAIVPVSIWAHIRTPWWIRRGFWYGIINPQQFQTYLKHFMHAAFSRLTQIHGHLFDLPWPKTELTVMNAMTNFNKKETPVTSLLSRHGLWLNWIKSNFGKFNAFFYLIAI